MNRERPGLGAGWAQQVLGMGKRPDPRYLTSCSLAGTFTHHPAIRLVGERVSVGRQMVGTWSPDVPELGFSGRRQIRSAERVWGRPADPLQACGMNVCSLESSSFPLQPLRSRRQMEGASAQPAACCNSAADCTEGRILIADILVCESRAIPDRCRWQVEFCVSAHMERVRVPGAPCVRVRCGVKCES